MRWSYELLHQKEYFRTDLVAFCPAIHTDLLLCGDAPRMTQSSVYKSGDCGLGIGINVVDPVSLRLALHVS